MHTCRHKHFQPLLSLHCFLGPVDSPKPPLPGACQQWPLFPLTREAHVGGGTFSLAALPGGSKKVLGPQSGEFLGSALSLAPCLPALPPSPARAGVQLVCLSTTLKVGVCVWENWHPCFFATFPWSHSLCRSSQRAYMRPVGLQQLQRVHVCLKRPREGERMGPVSPWPSGWGCGLCHPESTPLCAAWPQKGQGQGPEGAVVGGAPPCWVSSGLAQDTLTSQGRICSFA